jgi:glycosyltransferase involved in cell wall biosynthesis
MRIGYLTYGLDRAPAGIGRYAVELLRALAALPNCPEIVLLTTERADMHQLWNQFEHHDLTGCRMLPGLLTIGNAALSSAIRRYQLDGIHDPNGIAPFLGLAPGAWRITTIHDAFAYIYPEKHNRLDNWRYRWHLPYAARRADAVITPSECSRCDLMHYLGLASARVQVVPEGVDLRFRPIAAEACRAVLSRYAVRAPYLLYVGGINARKNIARLFEAYVRLSDQHPALTLVIGGKRQWQTGEIDTTLRRLDLMDHVHYTGYIDDRDLPALYSAAEVFVFPSLYEGFGLPVIEAMSCGTPVVTSNVSSLPAVAGGAALTVDPLDVDGLAHAIDRVLTDTALDMELRRHGLERAAQFTWEVAARSTLAIYEMAWGSRAALRQAPYVK